MPNRHNIDAPVILLGPGRSGSSLIMSLFAHHPDCATVGETANVIFGPWQGIVESDPGITPLIEDGRHVPGDERAGRAVREVFLTCFPDDRRFWMQKPVAVPKALLRFEDPGSDEAGAWYWRALRASFPRARYLIALRHPCDVVLSSRAKWGFDDASIWRTQANIAGLVLHADAPAVHAVNYDALVANPEAETRKMFDATEVPFDRSVLQAFGTVHVPVHGRERPSDTGFSRRHEWDTLDPEPLTAEHRHAIARLYERYGVTLEWPDAFLHAPRPAGRQEDESIVEQLKTRITELNRRIERMHLDHADALRRQQEAHEQAWNAHLAAVRVEWETHIETSRLDWEAHAEASRVQWEEHQRVAAEEFRQYNERTTRVFNEQQAWITELEQGKAWLESQVESWRAMAEGREPPKAEGRD